MATKLEHVTNVLLIVTCSALSVVLVSRLWNGRSGQSAAPPVENVERQDLTVAIDARAAEGNPNATLTLIEFSDFECPFCARHVRDTYPRLRDNYIATGKLRHVFRHFPLSMHRFAFDSAKAAECAEWQGRYWQMMARLFDNQRSLAPADLRAHARAAGLDERKFTDCMNDPATSAQLEKDRTEAERLTVESTPTFFVGMMQADGKAKLLRKVTGAQAYSVFVTALEEAADAVAARPALPLAAAFTSAGRTIRSLVRASQ